MPISWDDLPFELKSPILSYRFNAIFDDHAPLYGETNSTGLLKEERRHAIIQDLVLLMLVSPDIEEEVRKLCRLRLEEVEVLIDPQMMEADKELSTSSFRLVPVTTNIAEHIQRRIDACLRLAVMKEAQDEFEILEDWRLMARGSRLESLRRLLAQEKIELVARKRYEERYGSFSV